MAPSIKNQAKSISKTKTVKRKYSSNNSTPILSATGKKFEGNLVCTFLQMLNTVKLYHWKTMSYATHKATDELYSKLGENIDKFVEVLLGKYGNRINLVKTKSLPLKDMSSPEEFKKEIMKYKTFLVNLDNDPTMKQMSNTDLFNIRDEIMGDLNQFLYLYTFK
jgi:DNA-binding ferritin-like protein